jgi:hypothetical protein
MTIVSVITDDTNQMCCGEHREVGDVVTIRVFNSDGALYEERHGGGLGLKTQSISGTITAIHWRPAIKRRLGYQAIVIEGYGPGRQVGSEHYRDPEVDAWAFDFTVDTDDPLPAPRPPGPDPDIGPRVGLWLQRDRPQLELPGPIWTMGGYNGTNDQSRA